MVGRSLPLFFLVVTLASLAATSARAGEGWSVRVRHVDGAASGDAQLWMEGDRIRAGQAGVSQEVILGREGITVLDHSGETYMVITYRQIENTLAPLMRSTKQASEEQRKELEAALEGLTPEERAEVEAQLGSLGEAEDVPDIRIEAADGSESIAGLSASKFVVSREERPVMEVWVTNRIPLDPLVSVSHRLAPLLDGLGGEGAAKHWRMLDTLPGFPLKAVDVSGKEPVEILRVTEAAERKFTDADFSAPAGYRKSMNWLGGGE